MSQTLTAIVVGLGDHTIAEHIPTILRSQDIEIVGVCDPNPLARQRLSKAFPDLNRVCYADDLDDLLNRVRPSVAFVAVPHDQYFDILVTLCRHRIPFLKEKPLARDLSEANAILSIPDFTRYGFIATQRRYSPLFQSARKSVATLTDVYLFHVAYTMNVDSPDAGWRGRRGSAGGGCLIDMGYHMIDQLVWWFGRPERVSAHISALAVPDGAYDAEDSATVLLGYPSGLHGVLVVSRAAGIKSEMYEVYGSNGYLTGSATGFTVHDRAGMLINWIQQDPPRIMLDQQLAYFLSRVREGSGFADVQSEHLANMELIDRCYRDARADLSD